MVDIREERRCPHCGALVSSEAEWCGQCLARLESDAAEPADPARPANPEPARPSDLARSTVPAGSKAETTGAAAAYWPCPVCGARNPVEALACMTCGTSFADAMRRGEERPTIEPKEAFSRSLLFPGLGHRALGRSLDGLARATLFAVSFLMALAVASAGVRRGPVFAIFLIFLVFALVVYFGSAIEAYRLAQGEPPLVSSKALLWTVVVIVLASVLLLALSVASATGG